ncbi:MAG: HD domain-containing protein [Anaerolineae bacterium]|nr:HD domain-containing protein [Anaerolineae bacterium]
MLSLSTNALQPGMVLAKTIFDEQGKVLLRQGVELTNEYISNLKRRGFSKVYINDNSTSDIVIEDILSEEIRRSAQNALARVFDFVHQVSIDTRSSDTNKTIAAIKSNTVSSVLRSNEGFKQLEEVVTSILDELTDIEMLTGMSQIQGHDDAVFNHSIEVTVAALMIGKRLHLNREDLRRLGAGCILHDIGKIFVTPRSGGGEPLLLEQKKNLREHPRLGYELLRTRNPNAVMTNHVALEHHERQDGLGYPRGLRGHNTIERPRSATKNILLIAEIAAVADTYDILSTNRLGGRPLTPRQVADTLHRLSGTVLNREIVQLFLTMLPILPTGMNIVVCSGRYVDYKGVVVKANREQQNKPLIRLLSNPQGNSIVPIDIDLTQESSITVEAILR